MGVPWVLWMSLGTLWATFGYLLGGLWVAFGRLWGCLGTPLGSMPKTYPKQTLPIIFQEAKILLKRVTVINFSMWPSRQSGLQTAPAPAPALALEGKGGTTLGILPLPLKSPPGVPFWSPWGTLWAAVEAMSNCQIPETDPTNPSNSAKIQNCRHFLRVRVHCGPLCCWHCGGPSSYQGETTLGIPRLSLQNHLPGCLWGALH